MLKLRISNPIFQDLIKLKLIKRNNLKILFHKTRDKKIRVLQDQKSKIIFLEEDVNNEKKYIKKPSSPYFQHLQKIKKLKVLKDDKNRFNLFKKEIKNKKILDYGCGMGGFLSLANKISKLCEGYEIMQISKKK